MVSSLQKKGLIQAIISKKDARHKAITFTAKGKKLLERIKPVWNALQKAMTELTDQNLHSKKILSALTGLEKSVQQKNLFERIEEHL